jgi:hypothetical protein
MDNRELEWLNIELQLEDEMAKASEQMEMLGLMERAYENGGAYGKGYSDGFIAGVKFFHEREAAKWISRKEKYDEFIMRRRLSEQL